MKLLEYSHSLNPYLNPESNIIDAEWREITRKKSLPEATPYNGTFNLPMRSAIEGMNAIFRPDRVKQGNNATGDILSNGLDVIYYIDVDKNIEEIGKIYETIGYKVNKIVDGNPITLNRQLYNYIQCSEIELEITMLSSLNIINDLENRFINGLRLWNVTKMESLNLSLGDVCIYDNKEIKEVVVNE